MSAVRVAIRAPLIRQSVAAPLRGARRLRSFVARPAVALGLLALSGAAAVVAGIAVVYWPAALILGGLAAAAAGLLIETGTPT